jgi:hypothetical protein
MNLQSSLTLAGAVGALVTLFMAVWLPCCVSDIVFPLLFAKSDIEIDCGCPYHGDHGSARKVDDE